MGRVVKAYWWDKYPNLGDALTPLLLEYFGHQVERAEPQDADMCVVGSVLEVLGPGFGGSIIGTGFISDGAPMAFPDANFLAVRGPLTARRAGLGQDVEQGDAGILSPLLLRDRPRPHVRIGVVPHYKDKVHPAITTLCTRSRENIRVIDVQDDPRNILTAIAECEVILSSSLHGLIAGDAFGRRTAWLKLSDAVIGNGFKFMDYGLSVGVALRPTNLSGAESTDELAALASKKHFDRAGTQRRLEAVFGRL